MVYCSGSRTFFVHGALQKLINTRGAFMKQNLQILNFTKKLYLNHVHYLKCTKISALFAKYKKTFNVSSELVALCIFFKPRCNV